MHQRLILKDSGRAICELSDDTKMLGFYSVNSGMEIHIIDTDPHSLSRNGGLTDTSLIQKYKMSDEDYSKRKGTLREYVQEQRKQNPNFKLLPKGVPQPSAPQPVPDASTCAHVILGSRCEITPGARRGTVVYIGETTGKSGYWVRICHNFGCFSILC